MAAFVAATVLYGPTLFAGWHYEVFCLRGGWEVFGVRGDSAMRYSPLGTALLGAFPAPGLLRACVLAMYAATAALISPLSFRLGASRISAGIAVALFLSCPHHTESVAWLPAGVYYVPATLLSVSSCVLLLSTWVADRRVAALTAFMVVAAPFFHEQAVVLPIVLSLVLVAARQPWTRTRVLIVGMASISSTLLVVIKAYAAFHFDRELGIHSLSWIQRAQSLAEGLFWALPTPLAPPHPPWLGLAIPLAIAAFSIRNRRLWLLLGCWLLTLAPAVLVSWPQSRYYHLPSVWFGVWVAAQLGQARVTRPQRLWALAVTACFAVLVVNLRDHVARMRDWIDSSSTYDGTTSQIARVVRRTPASGAIALIDFPGTLATHREVQVVGLFRGCTGLAVEFELQRLGETPPRVELARTRDCSDCSPDLPEIQTIDSTHCFVFNRRTRRAESTICPGRGAESEVDPPTEGRLSLRPTASAYNEADLHEMYAPERAVDGVRDTEWHLPDETAGWLDLEIVEAGEIESVWIANAHNPGYEDRATRLMRVEVYQGDARTQVFSLRFHALETQSPWRVIRVPPNTRATRVRIDVLSWHGLGGGVAEVVIL